MEVVVSFVPSAEWCTVVLSAMEVVSGVKGSVGGRLGEGDTVGTDLIRTRKGVFKDELGNNSLV